MIDITELNAEDRQKALMAMPAQDIALTLNKLMRDSRPTEIAARLDALTVYMLRTDGSPR